jgi:hypothetical protein
VDPISKVGWPEIQAGLLVRHFHDWQRVRPRPQGRGRDRGRPTGSVVGRHPVRVEEGDGTRPGDSGGRIGAVACMAEILRHRVGGHRASLDEEDGGKRKERLREWQSGKRGTAPLYPSKAADTCQDTLNHSAFSVRSQEGGPGVHPHEFYDLTIRFLHCLFEARNNLRCRYELSFPALSICTFTSTLHLTFI